MDGASRVTLASMNNLALLLRDKGDYAEPEPLFRRALEERERTPGKEHSDTLKQREQSGRLVAR